MKTLLRFILKLLFGYRVHGIESLRVQGPVLLVPNHVSWLDWLLVGVVLEEDWRFVVSSEAANRSFFHRLIMVNKRTFPVDTHSPYAVRAMAEYLEKGGRLVLFAEGRISVTGSLMKIFDGTGFLLHRTGAKLITCHLHGAERSRLAIHPGWKRWFPRISVHFSAVLTAPSQEGVPHSQVRGRLTTWLRDSMVAQQFDTEMRLGARTVHEAFAQVAGNCPSRIALEDVTFTPLTYRRALVAVNLLTAVLRRLPKEEARVGVLLPNMSGTPLILMALWAAGRTPAMLNYSSGPSVMLECARLAGLRTVITSEQFLAKAKIDPTVFAGAGITLLDTSTLRAGIPALAKLGAALVQRLLPGSLTTLPVDPESTAVVLFTSGSEGMPKGVELSHRNLLANVRQSIAVIDVGDHDHFFNALPLFHSFGLTAGTLFPLLRGCRVFMHPSPLQYRAIPALVYDKCCTVLLGTNTFLNGYARKANAYDFNSVRYLIAGAERVQATTFDTWARRFGVRILEGYGATECSPVISVNTRTTPCFGSAGRLLPGIEHRLETVDGVSEGGRLLVRGPNVMKGYLNADAQAKFAQLDGWYDTGDIVTIDADGYVRIQGRLKRFAKISGEMVSLSAVEDALSGAFPVFGVRCEVAVVSIPDADKGEMLVAVANEPRLTLAEVRQAIRAKGLSNLCAPRALLFKTPLPKLGTGKANHRELQSFAQESLRKGELVTA